MHRSMYILCYYVSRLAKAVTLPLQGESALAFSGLLLISLGAQAAIANQKGDGYSCNEHLFTYCFGLFAQFIILYLPSMIHGGLTSNSYLVFSILVHREAAANICEADCTRQTVAQWEVKAAACLVNSFRHFSGHLSTNLSIS